MSQKFLSEVNLQALNNATTDTDKFLVSDSGTIKYRTGAEVLSDIGGQAALTNPITGTGSVNQVAKFTFVTSGAATIGNSQIFDNGTNVGIGTTSPSQKLSIVGGSNTYAQVNNGSNSIYLGQISSYGLIQSDLDLALLSGGSERMRITSAGNVGIGTSSPNYASSGRTVLDINGSSQSLISLSVGGTGKSLFFYTGTDLLVSNESNGAIKFNTNGSEKAIITSAGNVGIGTTSPVSISNYTTLDLRGTNGSLLYIGQAGYTASLRLIGEGTDGYIDNLNSTGSLLFRTNNATERMRITSGGNVGIGTTSPNSILDVREANRIFDQFGNINVFTSNAFAADIGGSIALGGASNTSGGISPYPFAKLQGIKEGTGAWAGALILGTTQSNSAITEKMRITSAGNVGIGTESPSEKLVVGGLSGAVSTPTSIRLDDTYRAGGDAFDKLKFYLYKSASETYGLGLGDISDVQYWAGTTSTGNHRFFTSQTERLRITSAGNVGIGTSSPSSKLTVSANDVFNQDSSGQIIITGASDQNKTLSFGFDTTSNYGYIQSIWRGNSSKPLVLQPWGGNVGIGTTAPTTKLEVVGNIKSSLSGYEFQIYPAFDTNVVGMGASSNHNLAIVTNATERMRITSAGNVGIGTTSPYAKLDINGNARVYGANLLLDFTGNVGGIQWGLNPYIQGIANGGFEIRDNTSGLSRFVISSSGNVGIGTTSPATLLDLYKASFPVAQISSGTITGNMGIDTSNNFMNFGTTTNHDVSFATNNAPRMRITNTGNVGIGTTSPNEKLTVSGKIYANPQQPVVLSGQGAPYYGTNITLSSDIGSTQGANRIWSRYDGTGRAAMTFETNTTTQSYNSDPQSLSYTETMRITGNGNVGIGNTNPTNKLIVDYTTNGADGIISRNLSTGTSAYAFVGAFANTGGIDLRSYPSTNPSFPSTSFISSSSTQTGGILVSQAGANPIRFFVNGGEQVRISSSGYLGVGNSSPSYPLHVSSQVSNVSIYADYDIVAYSDQSVKENIRPIDNALERVIESRGVLYDRIDSGEKDNIGFIAQELEVAFPELVVTNPDGTKAVKYQNAVAVLFEAVKEQQKQIDEIKRILNGLTN